MSPAQGMLLDENARHQDESREHGKKALTLKAFVLKTLGLHNLGADRLVEEALRFSHGQPPPGSPLSLLVKDGSAGGSGASGRHDGPRPPLPAADRSGVTATLVSW